MTLLVTVLIVIWDILILILEGAPRIKVVPEIIEVLDFFLRAVLIAEFWYRLDSRKSCFGFKDRAP